MLSPKYEFEYRWEFSLPTGWKKITKERTGHLIDIIKGLNYATLEIYKNMPLTKNQEEELYDMLRRTESKFLSRIYRLNKTGISFEYFDISRDESDHEIFLDPDILSGKEIVKIGFSEGSLFSNNLHDGTQDDCPLELKKNGKNYAFRINSPLNTEEPRAWRYRNRLASLLKKEGFL